MNLKIGDYVTVCEPIYITEYYSPTVDRIIGIGEWVYAAEYYLHVMPHRTGFKRVTYEIEKNILHRLKVLSADDPVHKILIDKFNLAKMQYILEQ